MEAVHLGCNTSGECGSSCLGSDPEDGVDHPRNHMLIRPHGDRTEDHRSHARRSLLACCPSSCGSDRMSSAAGVSTCCCSTATHARGSQCDCAQSLFHASSLCTGTTPAGLADTVASAFSRFRLSSVVSSSVEGCTGGAAAVGAGVSYEPEGHCGTAPVREQDLFGATQYKSAECTTKHIEPRCAVRRAYTSRTKEADERQAGVFGGPSPITRPAEEGQPDTQPIYDHSLEKDPMSFCNRDCRRDFSRAKCCSGPREPARELSGTVCGRTDRSAGLVAEKAPRLRDESVRQTQSGHAGIHDFTHSSQNEAGRPDAFARRHSSRPRGVGEGRDRPVCCHPCGSTEHAPDKPVELGQEEDVPRNPLELSPYNASTTQYMRTHKPYALRERESHVTRVQREEAWGPVSHAPREGEATLERRQASQTQSTLSDEWGGPTVLSTIRQTDETRARVCHPSDHNGGTGTAKDSFGVVRAVGDSSRDLPPSRELRVSVGLAQGPDVSVFPPLARVDQLAWGSPSPRTRAYTNGQQIIQEASTARRGRKGVEGSAMHFQNAPVPLSIKKVDQPSQGVPAFFFDPDVDLPSASRSASSSASWSPRSGTPPRTSSSRGSRCPANRPARPNSFQDTHFREESGRELQSPNHGLMGMTKRRVGPASCVSIAFVSSGSSTNRSNSSFDSGSVRCPDNLLNGVVHRHGSGCGGHHDSPPVPEFVPGTLTASPSCTSAEKVSRTAGSAGSCSSRTSNSGNTAGITVTATAVRRPASATADTWSASPSVTSDSRRTSSCATASTIVASRSVDVRDAGFTPARDTQPGVSWRRTAEAVVSRQAHRNNSAGINERPQDGRGKGAKGGSSVGSVSSASGFVSLGRSSSSSSFAGMSKRTVRMWSGAAAAPSTATAAGQTATSAAQQTKKLFEPPSRLNSAVGRFSGSSVAGSNKGGEQLASTVPKPATKRRARLVAPAPATSDGAPPAAGSKAPLKSQLQGKASNLVASEGAQRAAAELQSRAGGGGLSVVVGKSSLFGSLFASRSLRETAREETEDLSLQRSQTEYGLKEIAGSSQGKKVRLGEQWATRVTEHTDVKTSLSKSRSLTCHRVSQTSSPPCLPGVLIGNVGRLSSLPKEICLASERKSTEARGSLEFTASESPNQADTTAGGCADGLTRYSPGGVAGGVRSKEPTVQAGYGLSRTAGTRTAGPPPTLSALSPSLETVRREKSICSADSSFPRATDPDDAALISHKPSGGSEGEARAGGAHRVSCYRAAAAVSLYHATNGRSDALTNLGQSLKRDFHPETDVSGDYVKNTQEQPDNSDATRGYRHLQRMVARQLTPLDNRHVTWKPTPDRPRTQAGAAKLGVPLAHGVFPDSKTPPRGRLRVHCPEDDDRVSPVLKSGCFRLSESLERHAADDTCGGCSCRHCLPSASERGHLSQGEHYSGDSGTKCQTPVCSQHQTIPASREGGSTVSASRPVNENHVPLPVSPGRFVARRGQTADVAHSPLKDAQQGRVNDSLKQRSANDPRWRTRRDGHGCEHAACTGQVKGVQRQQTLKAARGSKPSSDATRPDIIRSDHHRSLRSPPEHEDDILDHQELFRQRQEQQQLRLRLLMTRGPPYFSPSQSPRRVDSRAGTPEPTGSVRRPLAYNRADDRCAGRHPQGAEALGQAPREPSSPGTGAGKMSRTPNQGKTSGAPVAKRVFCGQKRKDSRLVSDCESDDVGACCQRDEDGGRRGPERFEGQGSRQLSVAPPTHQCGQSRIAVHGQDSKVLDEPATGAASCCSGVSESVGSPSPTLLGHRSACHSSGWNGGCLPNHCPSGSSAKRSGDTRSFQKNWESLRGPHVHETSSPCGEGDPLAAMRRCPTCNPGCCGGKPCSPDMGVTAGCPAPANCGGRPRTVYPPAAPHSIDHTARLSSFYALDPGKHLIHHAAFVSLGGTLEGKRQAKPRSPCRCCGRRRRSIDYESPASNESAGSPNSSRTEKSSTAGSAFQKNNESERVQAEARNLIRRPPPLKLPPSGSVLADVTVTPTARNPEGPGGAESRQIMQCFEEVKGEPEQPFSSTERNQLQVNPASRARLQSASVANSAAPSLSMLLFRRPPRLEEPQGPCGCGGICGRGGNNNVASSKVGGWCPLKAEKAGEPIRGCRTPVLERSSIHGSSENSSRVPQQATDDISCASGRLEKHGKVSDGNLSSVSLSPATTLAAIPLPVDQEDAQFHKPSESLDRCDEEDPSAASSGPLAHRTTSVTARNTGSETIRGPSSVTGAGHGQPTGSRCVPKSVTCDSHTPPATDEVLRTSAHSLVYSCARTKRRGSRCLSSGDTTRQELSALVKRSTVTHVRLSQTSLSTARVAAMERHFRNDYSGAVGNEDAAQERRTNTSCSLSGKQSWLVSASEKECEALDNAKQDAQRPRSGEDCVRKDRLRELYKIRRRRARLSRGGASSRVSSKSSSDESGAGENGSSEIEDTDSHTASAEAPFRRTERNSRSASFPEAVLDQKRIFRDRGEVMRTPAQKDEQDSSQHREVGRAMSVPSGVLHSSPGEATLRGTGASRFQNPFSSPALVDDGARLLSTAEGCIRTDTAIAGADSRESLGGGHANVPGLDSLTTPCRRAEEVAAGQSRSQREGADKGDKRLPSDAVISVSSSFGSTAKERDRATVKSSGHLYPLSAGKVQQDQVPLREDHEVANVFAVESSSCPPVEAFQADNVLKCGPETESPTTGETDRDTNRSRRAIKKRSAVAIEKKRSSTSAGSCDGFDDAASTPLFCSLSSSSFSSSSAAGPVDATSSWSVFSPADSQPKASEDSSRLETSHIPQQLALDCPEVRVKTEQVSTASPPLSLQQQV